MCVCVCVYIYHILCDPEQLSTLLWAVINLLLLEAQL